MKNFRRTDAGLFCLVFLAAACIHHPVDYDNTQSRFCLLSSVVDFGRLDIDMYKDETIDISVVDGVTYSNKAIGAPLVASPIYWMLRNLTPIRHDRPLSPRAVYICTLLSTALPFAILGIVLFRFQVLLGADPVSAYISVLAYAFGSIAWIHATLFSGHQMAANFAFFSFALIHLFSRNIITPGVPGWFGAGLLAGLAALADYTAITIACILAVYAFVKTRSPSARAAFLAGGSIAAAVLFAYNTRCFGSPFSFSYAHLAYGEFAMGARQGVLGVALPDPAALLSLLASPARGLFFIMPVLLMSLPGFWIWFNRPSLRSECLAAGMIVAVYFLINAGFYAWHGGWTFGPRYLVPMLPFLVLPMAFALDRQWILPLFLVSFAQVGFAQMVMPHTPEEIMNPIVECIYPLFQYGYFSETIGTRLGFPGLVSFLAVLAAGAILAWWSRPRPDLRTGAAGDTISESWRPVYPLAIVGIVAGLLAVRSPAVVGIHMYNAKLLGHAAYQLKSDRLARAAMQEERFSREGIR